MDPTRWRGELEEIGNKLKAQNVKLAKQSIELGKKRVEELALVPAAVAADLSWPETPAEQTSTTVEGNDTKKVPDMATIKSASANPSSCQLRLTPLLLGELTESPQSSRSRYRATT